MRSCGTSACFYEATLRELIAARRLDRNARTLVVCAGQVDRDVLARVGFADVALTNLDPQQAAAPPFEAAYQDAEGLTYADRSFDQVIVHEGLHHCASPHRALTEMYRVSARAILIFEPRDTLPMRVARALGLVSDHEVEAVADNSLCAGGLRNSAIPNFIYRWTRREIEKTLASYDPSGPIRPLYFYGSQLPVERFALYRSPAKRLLGRAALFAARLLIAAFPKAGNLFAVYAERPRGRFPWLTEAGVDEGWFAHRFAA